MLILLFHLILLNTVSSQSGWPCNRKWCHCLDVKPALLQITFSSCFLHFMFLCCWPVKVIIIITITFLKLTVEYSKPVYIWICNVYKFNEKLMKIHLSGVFFIFYFLAIIKLQFLKFLNILTSGTELSLVRGFSFHILFGLCKRESERREEAILLLFFLSWFVEIQTKLSHIGPSFLNESF